jgi:hypothetical protein
VQVINAYAEISNVETATASVLSTTDTRKLLGQCGGFAWGQGSPWLERIAKKFVGCRMVHTFHLSDPIYLASTGPY